MAVKLTHTLTLCLQLALIVCAHPQHTQAQTLTPDNPDLPPPQDVQPPTPEPLPTPPSPQLPPPSDLLEPLSPDLQPDQELPATSQTVTVKKFDVVGSTVFSDKQLQVVLAPFLDRPLTFAELLQAAKAVTKLYTDNKYITSGAYIPGNRVIVNGVVPIVVVEGRLEEIQITGTQRLKPQYIRSRIARATKPPLNQEKLLESLQLLQINPLIENLQAELSSGTRIGTNILSVSITEAPSFSVQTILDNARSPSVGSFRRQIGLQEANLLGWGDSIDIAYSNTDGSNVVEGSYTLPLNSRDGKLSVSYNTASSEVIEEPFDKLDIESNSSSYELTFRQPLLQTPSNEFAIGLSATHRESEISSDIDGTEIPPNLLSPGADEDGNTRVWAMRFFQEWTQRDSQEVLAARSQFNLGLGVFDATINSDPEPDSRFLSWQGQAQWVRLLAPETLLLVRAYTQLGLTSLVPSEQFGLGGIDNVRGYRSNLLLKDSGAFASAEIRLPIARISDDGLLQVAPFFDIGTTWDNSDSEGDRPLPDTLASLGLGLRWTQGDNFSAQFYWGIPLVSVDTSGSSLQENGLYFSVQYNPF